MIATCPWLSSAASLEVLKAFPSIITAITAIIGLAFAKRGLDKWHAETIGKRKAELAEQALAAFYEARDVFIWVRSPGMFGREGESRTAAAEETDQQRRDRNTLFVPLERLTRNAELFARIYTLRYSFAAHFGPAAIEPFQAIHMAQVEISSTVGVLIQLVDASGTTAGYRGHDSDAELRSTLWGAPERPDKFDKAIETAVQQIEHFCRPVLEKAAP